MEVGGVQRTEKSRARERLMKVRGKGMVGVKHLQRESCILNMATFARASVKQLRREHREADELTIRISLTMCTRTAVILIDFPQNVEKGMWSQFKIPEPAAMKSLELDIPYDYFSIMHYGKSSFGKKDADVSMYK